MIEFISLLDLPPRSDVGRLGDVCKATAFGWTKGSAWYTRWPSTRLSQFRSHLKRRKERVRAVHQSAEGNLLYRK